MDRKRTVSRGFISKPLDYFPVVDILDESLPGRRGLVGIPAPVAAQKVADEGLRDQHLAAAKHAAPAAVAAVGGAIQDRKLAAVRQPEFAHEVVLETLEALLVTSGYLKMRGSRLLLADGHGRIKCPRVE